MSQLIINDITELSAAAKEIVSSFKDQKMILFYGEMGAGKTTLIKAICTELAVKDAVSSPTFSIVNEYHTLSDKKIYHFDFYRIKSVDEAYDLGYEDYFYSKNYCFIEWPEKIAEILPLEHIKINIELKGQQRVITY
jgi:tRNA threonylcarbamoyladenosine biosynthesis protein TsaE